MGKWIQFIITVVCSIIASTGFWSYVQRKCDRKDSRSQMIMGLGHDRIIYLGLHYIERGWITNDEYENLYDYLYVPYLKMGGNGAAKRIMEDVNKLPICKREMITRRGETDKC